MKLTLRELFLLVALVAVCCGWWASERARDAEFKRFQTDTGYSYRWRQCAEALGDLLKDEGWTIKWDFDSGHVVAEWRETNATPRPVSRGMSTSAPILNYP